MRRALRPRNIILTVLALPVVLLAGCYAEFAIRYNYICKPGYHIIRSDADAIEQAQMWFYQARFSMGGKPDRVEWSQTSTCCSANRLVNGYGLIGWQVFLSGGKTIGEETVRPASAEIWLSNCGEVFRGASFVYAGSAVREKAARE